MSESKTILAFAVGFVMGIIAASRPEGSDETLDERPGEDLGYIPEDLVY